jgi:hypothetical protein
LVIRAKLSQTVKALMLKRESQKSTLENPSTKNLLEKNEKQLENRGKSSNK